MRETAMVVLGLVLPFVDVPFALHHVRVLGREAQHVVDHHLWGVKHIALSQVTFASCTALHRALVRSFNLPAVLSLVLDNTRVRRTREEEEEEDAPVPPSNEGGGEWKCRTADFPVGLLPNMRRLALVRVRSQSFKHDFFQQQHASSASLPLQLTLANLHELASGACCQVERVQCMHEERSQRTGELTDVWGPEATLRVLRQFKLHCPQLRELGVLSSPGPRVRQELQRLSSSSSRQAIASEVGECFRTSFLDGVADLLLVEEEEDEQQQQIQVWVSLCTHNAPESSMRSVVLAAAPPPQHQHLQQQPPELGELADVAALHARRQGSSGHVCVVVRAVARRVHGRFSARAMRETAEISALRRRMQEHNTSGVSLVSVPGDGVSSVLRDGHLGVVQLQPDVLSKVLMPPMCRSISWASSMAAAAVVALPPPPPPPPPAVAAVADHSLLVDEPWDDGQSGGVVLL